MDHQDENMLPAAEVDQGFLRHVVGQLERWAGKYDLEKTRRRVQHLLEEQGFQELFDGKRQLHAMVSAPSWVATVTPHGIALAERAEEAVLPELPEKLRAQLVVALRHPEAECCVDGIRALLRSNPSLGAGEVYAIISAANRRLGFTPETASLEGKTARSSTRGNGMNSSGWMVWFYAKGFELMPMQPYTPDGSENTHAAREYTDALSRYLQSAGEHADWDWVCKIVREHAAKLTLKRPAHVEAICVPAVSVVLHDGLRRISLFGPHAVLQERASVDAPWREPHNAV